MPNRLVSLIRVGAALVAVAALAGCSHADTAPPVASVSFTASRTRVALGSPVDLTYRFDVAPNAKITGDYRVFLHVVNPDGTTMWTDDHDPPVPTSQWKPGQTIQYTRTKFVPDFPYLGQATVKVGLYKDAERLPLSGSDPADRKNMSREYTVGTLDMLPRSDNVLILYKAGWYPAEVSPTDPTIEWQWTGKAAVANVQNPKKDATLYLDYEARPDAFDHPQVVTVSLGDQVVTSFPADSAARTLKKIPIAAAQFGTGEMAELRLSVDRTFVPAQSPVGGHDVRELGLEVYHLFVEPK